MIDILVQDHREVEELFRELEDPDTGPQRRGQLVSVVAAELVRHWLAEEKYLYSAIRQVLPGDEVAEKEVGDRSVAKQMLRRLEWMQPTDTDFDATVCALICAVREGISEEERRVFPRLREECSPAQLAKSGARIDRAKRAAPSRPRPGAPSASPANKLLEPGTGLADRVRDALRDRLASRADPVAVASPGISS